MKRHGSSALTIESKKDIRKWIVISLIKGLFGGSSDSVLTKAQKTIKNSIDKNPDMFPWQILKKDFSGGNKTLNVYEDDIESMLDNPRLTFPILAILYPDIDLKQKIDIDHIFPKEFFKITNLKNKIKENQDIKDCIDRKDHVVNLQFLPESENIKKSNKEPLEWLKELCGNDENKIIEWKEKNYVGDLSLGIENFLMFYKQRRKKIKIKLTEALIN